jgi:hypothetical protein
MNIFYLHYDVKYCAEMHNDKHCVKMILEYAQLLSTAHRVIDGVLTDGFSQSGRKAKRYILADERDSILYSATHINHPSAVWVRQSDANYVWLFRLFGALMDEYTYRYGKTHACERLADALSHRPKNIPKGNFTEPTPAMPDEYKVFGNSIESYRSYYINSKSHLAKWKERSVPVWYTEGHLEKLVRISEEVGESL